MKKNYKKEKFKTKQEWIEARGLGGTSASAITGHSKRKNILELFTQIMCPKKFKVDSTNTSMLYGIACEPLLRKMFALDFPQYKVLTPKNFEMYRRIDKPYITATIDSTLIEKETGRKGILEIKTHEIRNREDEEEWNGHIPQDYYEQVIWYLVCMNDMEFVRVMAKLNFYDYFDPSGKKLLNSEIRYYTIERSERSRHIVNLEKMATRFWENNVKKGIIPDIKIDF